MFTLNPDVADSSYPPTCKPQSKRESAATQQWLGRLGLLPSLIILASDKSKATKFDLVVSIPFYGLRPALAEIRSQRAEEQSCSFAEQGGVVPHQFCVPEGFVVAAPTWEARPKGCVFGCCVQAFRAGCNVVH